MSSAKRMRSSKMRAQGGYSFIELSISMTLIVVMALIVERTLDSTRRAEGYLSAVRQATERGHKLTYEIRELVTASRRLFFNDAEGQAYLGALELGGKPILPGARLPVVDPLGRLGPDQDGDPHTGNVLLFVGETDSTPAVSNPVGPLIRHIDTYRFVCCYPRASGRRVVVSDENSPEARDLVVWQSVEFPSYKQLMSIADEDERSTVVADLVNRFGVEMAWDATADVANAFYDLDGTGTISSDPVGSPVIAEDPDESQGGRLVYAKVQLARTDNEDPRRKAVMSVDDPAAWAPDGFEIKIAGASGSRKVWMHLVVEVQAAKGEVAVQPCTIIASVKDL